MNKEWIIPIILLMMMALAFVIYWWTYSLKFMLAIIGILSGITSIAIVIFALLGKGFAPLEYLWILIPVCLISSLECIFILWTTKEGSEKLNDQRTP